MTPAERDLLIAIAEHAFSPSRTTPPIATIKKWIDALNRVRAERDASDPVGHAMRVSNDELRLP